jgi:hypothetical protein
MNQKITFNDAEKQEIIKQYKTFHTPKQISQQFLVSEPTIYRNIINFGILTRSRGYKHKIINLNYSENLAFFVALILGDGWLCHNKKTNNYNITMETSNLEQIKIFEDCIKNSFPQLSIWKSSRNHKRKFKDDGKVYTNKTYLIGVSSKMLHNFIKPLKNNFYINIPKWIYSNKGFIYGFLDGFIYAEGSFHKDKRYLLKISQISIVQKRLSNLIKLREMLKFVKINSIISKKPEGCYVLNINRKKDIQTILNNCPRCKTSVKIQINKNK